MILKNLIGKYPEIKLEDTVLTSIPVFYETKLYINDRVVFKVRNLTRISDNHDSILTDITNYGLTMLIHQSTQP